MAHSKRAARRYRRGSTISATAVINGYVHEYERASCSYIVSSHADLIIYYRHAGPNKTPIAKFEKGFPVNHVKGL